MKFALAFLTLFFLSNTFSQTGGVVVSFDRASSISDDSIAVQIWKDSTLLFSQSTVEKLISRDLPAGKVDLYCSYKDSLFVYKQPVYIQANQLVYHSYEVDSSLLAIQGQGEGKFAYSNDPTISTRSTHRDPQEIVVSTYRQVDANHMNFSVSADVLQIEEVAIVAYASPLIDKDGGATGTTITREDIARLPSRNAFGIASTVGGVHQTEDPFALHFRGARAKSNAYYLDGMRVNSLNGIPKSYMQEVQVITGGVPACYGDATGGIISVQGKSYFDVVRERSQASIIQSANSYSRRRPPSASTYNTYTEPEVDILSFDRFSEIYENDFLSPLTSPNSTFGIGCRSCFMDVHQNEVWSRRNHSSRCCSNGRNAEFLQTQTCQNRR
jgi:hypothetical protein